MERWILHVDLDAFYASVEELDHPEWKGSPLIVGADPQDGRGRGVVTTANYEARKSGVRSAMPISEAWRRAPQARFVPPRFHRYSEKSDEVFAIVRQMADRVEQSGIDEGYLDVTDRCGSHGEALDLARAIQERIERETGLSISIGVASNKVVAKIATDMRKPHGITGVPSGTEQEFLSPLPARKIPGVGPKTEERLVELGITTCAELAVASASLLHREFGAWGPRLTQLARGIDDSPVEAGWERKSIGSETTFDEDETDPAEWERTLRDLAAGLADSLKEERLVGRTITLKVRLTGFETHTRARTLPRAVADAAPIGEAAISLLREFAPDRAVRLLGVRVTGLDDAEGRDEQAKMERWPADILGEAAPWRPRQRRLEDR
ncbi:MAG: DNA polymerase IV [Candidatus Thermoplasmatota archaeon]